MYVCLSGLCACLIIPFLCTIGHDNPLERMSSSTEVIEEEGVDAVNSKTSVNSSSSSSYVSKYDRVIS